MEYSVVVDNLEFCPSKIKHRKLLEYADEIIALYTKQNMTLREIGIKFNTDKDAIKRVLVKNNIQIHGGRTREYNIQCQDCGGSIKTKNPNLKRCQKCSRKHKTRQMFIKQRQDVGRNPDQIAKCIRCETTMPDKKIDRKYCDKCRRIRSYENKRSAWFKKPEHYRMKSIEHQQNRRARKYGSSCSHLDRKFLKLLREKYNECVYCGSDAKLTIDHVVPLALDGDNEMNNLVLACLSCNSSKHKKPLLNFLWDRYNSFGGK